MVDTKKYEFTDETIEYKGRILHRIKALKDSCFRGVRAGDLGGFIEKEENLSQAGECWVFDKAKVYDNAKVLDDTSVEDKAEIYGNAVVGGCNVMVGGPGASKVSGEAQIFDNARVSGSSIVDNGKVYGNAYIHKSDVHSNAEIYSDAHVYDSAIWGKAKVYDEAHLIGVSVGGNVKIHGKSRVDSLIRPLVINDDIYFYEETLFIRGDTHLYGESALDSFEDMVQKGECVEKLEENFGRIQKVKDKFAKAQASADSIVEEKGFVTNTEVDAKNQFE